MLRLFRLVSFVVVGILAALVLAPQVQALPTESPQGQGSLTVTKTATAKEQQAALQKWTREARLAAKPLPLPTVKFENLPRGAVTEKAVGAPGTSPGGYPNPNAEKSAQQQFPSEWVDYSSQVESRVAPPSSSLAVANSPLAQSPMGTLNVFDAYYANYWANMWIKLPWVAIGRLFFNAGSCSASVVSGNNVIVTAAHCVYDADKHVWYSGWSFVPAYRKGSAPYGTFPWASVTILTAWQTGCGRTCDVAVIKLGNNSAGHSVTYYTGWLGRAWNYGYTQHINAYGFPGNFASAAYMRTCQAESWGQATDIMGMGCDMTYGSSGGPWIRGLHPYEAVGNWVNNVVSGGDPSVPSFYAARFTSNNIVPLCNAAGC